MKVGGFPAPLPRSGFPAAARLSAARRIPGNPPRWRGLLLAAVLPLLGSAAMAADKPKVPFPEGLVRWPTGPQIAIIGDGVDYTDPRLAKELLRDGELELVGWDVVDGDRLPYERSTGPTPTQGTKFALGLGGVKIPVRVDAANPQSLAKGLGFAARTKSRIAVVPNINAEARNWDVLLAASESFAHLLFIVHANEILDADATWRRALASPNVLVVTGSAAVGRPGDWRAMTSCLSPFRLSQPPLDALAFAANTALTAAEKVGNNGYTGADLKRLMAAPNPETDPRGWLLEGASTPCPIPRH
jgi:hypothetical protein